MESLAKFLGVQDPRPDEGAGRSDFAALADITDPKKFCQAVVSSREFRQYIMNGIALGDIQPAIMGRIIDHAWGKAPDRVEHTGKDGQPIETVTEVIRRVVRPSDHPAGDVAASSTKYSTH